MTQRECQCVMDTSVTLRIQNGCGWVGLMCGLGLELVVRLHEGDRTIIIFRSLSGQLIGIQTSLVQGTAFWSMFFKQLVMKQPNLFIIIFLCIAKSKRCSVEKYEILIRVFAVDLTYMVVYTLLIPMSYLLPKTKGWNLSSCP